VDPSPDRTSHKLLLQALVAEVAEVAEARAVYSAGPPFVDPVMEFYWSNGYRMEREDDPPNRTAQK
jgi:hypothetical protein